MATISTVDSSMMIGYYTAGIASLADWREDSKTLEVSQTVTLEELPFGTIVVAQIAQITNYRPGFSVFSA